MSTRYALALVLASSAWTVAAQPAARILPADLQRLTGAPWRGSLTYLDYTSKKPVQIPSTLTVTREDAAGHTFRFRYEYPDEPKANSVGLMTLASDGAALDGEQVKERSQLAGGLVRIVTEKSGPDDGRPATFRFTYLIGDNQFSRKKEVQPVGTTGYFERHTYRWTR
jgi:hypothetical protein